MEKEKIDWDFVMTDSDFKIATELLKVYETKDYEELGIALRSYLKNSKSSVELELLRGLKNIMEAILLWNASNEFKTQERREFITEQIDDIELIIELDGYASNELLLKRWDEAFDWAKKSAADFTQENLKESLSWDEVFNPKL